MYVMACYEYHFITFPFSGKNKNSGGQVSDRSATVLATSVLHDLGLMSPIDRSKVIDRSKIRRECRKNCKELQLNGDQFDHSGIEVIFFDGRKDQTDTSSRRRKQVPQKDSHGRTHKHCRRAGFFILQPHDSAIRLQRRHHRVVSRYSLKELNAKTQNIKVIGRDGTNVNTGHTAGFIRRLEESFEHPVQWLACLFHANDLPLRHLFEALDGATTGPRGFSGSIRKRLVTCSEQPVSSFEPVQLTEQLSNVDPKELSTDQWYLMEICNTTSIGECGIDLAMRNLGCLNHSRWLTTANRILRLYVSDRKPSENLKTLVTYIIRVYAPM